MKWGLLSWFSHDKGVVLCGWHDIYVSARSTTYVHISTLQISNIANSQKLVSREPLLSLELLMFRRSVMHQNVCCGDVSDVVRLYYLILLLEWLVYVCVVSIGDTLFSGTMG